MKRIFYLGIRLSTIALFIVFLVFQSLDLAINVPTFHLDGAFQTASGLFRLDAGQLPGRNFFPYLGIGPLFLLYPIFKLSGSCLTSSVFSAKFITLLFGGYQFPFYGNWFFAPGI